MWFKKKHKFIIPITGEMIPLGEVSDETFRDGMIGCGFAIIPQEGALLAPCVGEIKMVFPTGHAIGLLLENGQELLIHAGIDTVELQGKGFHVHVKQGDRVKAGTPLLSIDIDLTFL